MLVSTLAYLPDTLNATAASVTRSPSVVWTVLSAGLSIAIGQSIILFINRVKPVRFFLSLLIQAIIFTFGYFFLSFSTWLVGQTFFATTLTYQAVANVIGLSYEPLKWAFLAALPYLGEPIFLLLSLGNFLLILVNFSGLSGLSIWQSFWCAILGWFVLRLLQQTIGHPLATLGEWLINRTAGLKLVRDRRGLTEILRAGAANTPKAINHEAGEVRDIQEEQPISDSSKVAPQIEENLTPLTNHSNRERYPSRLSRTTNRLLGWLSIALSACSIAIVLANLDKFIAIAAIVLIGAGLLAPLEALGWWAGWYGDRVETMSNPGKVLENIPPSSEISRYAIYLDGIGQSNYSYQPDVDRFLGELAAILPDDIVLISGFMPYSILNIPLTGDRVFGFFWRWVEGMKQARVGSKISFLINVQNMLTVAVAADRRYGPLYNQGMAQLIYNSLIARGYQPGSGLPVTLIGYSGGGEISMGALPFLKQALNTSIEVISLGGVISGNLKAISLEHLYHLVGDKDKIERLGVLLFPKRWSLFFLSYWNRAKRRGQISIISLGPVGHNGAGGVIDANTSLPNGRSNLQQTLDWVAGILGGRFQRERSPILTKPSNYERYRRADFNQLQYYPLERAPAPDRYRPIATWMGRLLLPEPEQRQTVRGALLEIHHADRDRQHWVGKIAYLRWRDRPEVTRGMRAATRDVYFSDDAEYSSRQQGLIHPTRLNRWRQVQPLESLAGARPDDDMLVMLHEPVTAIEVGETLVLEIEREPVQISGRYYGLVKILQPVAAGSDRFRVIHFNRQSRQFEGIEEILRLPEVIADDNGTLPATHRDLEKSPANATGWYIYGAPDRSGEFVVRSLAPRALFRLQPDFVIRDRQAAWKYLKRESWQNIAAQKGKIQSVLLSPPDTSQPWQEGDRALLLHVYGGIGGRKPEPDARGPVYFGHFSYGNARVIHDPLSDELRFEIEYHQVYTHNVRGLIAGNMHWSLYMGDRQWGFLGTRPVCDLLVKLDAFTADFEFDGQKNSALRATIAQLEAMMARYRIGDGTGATYVGPANNCAQDSNQALYASLRYLESEIDRHRVYLEQWSRRDPEGARRWQQLLKLKGALKRELMPLGSARADWQAGTYNLGSCLEDRPLKNLSIGLASWRTLLPRLASDTIAKIFLERGATVWVLRTNQVGGWDPDIEPLAPITLC